MHGLPGDEDSSVELVNVTYRGPRDINGLPLCPDPMYEQLKDEIEGMCLVATSWIESIGNHIYMRQTRVDIEELQVNMIEFLSTLQYPIPPCAFLASPVFENRPDEALRVYVANRTLKNEDDWDLLKQEFETLRVMVDNMRSAPKRVRRTPSGDEEPRNDMVVDSRSEQTSGSSSHESVPFGTDEWEWECADHHAQPKK